MIPFSELYEHLLAIHEAPKFENRNGNFEIALHLLDLNNYDLGCQMTTFDGEYFALLFGLIENRKVAVFAYHLAHGDTFSGDYKIRYGTPYRSSDTATDPTLDQSPLDVLFIPEWPLKVPADSRF